MVSLFHRDLGGAGRPPLVILHGMLGSSRNWQTAGRDLAGDTGSSAPAGFHVFALDLRNHGRSPPAPTNRYEDMLADVLAWLDAQRLPRVTLLGHSMGGKVAMLLACRHPERVERLIVVDIAPKDYRPTHGAEFAAMRELDLRTLPSRAEAERRFEARVPNVTMRKFLVTNLEQAEDGGWRWIINLPVLAAVLPELEKNPLGPGDRFIGPALFITGEKSRFVQPADHAAISHYFPAARIETIAGARHNPHMEAREAFVALITG